MKLKIIFLLIVVSFLIVGCVEKKVTVIPDTNVIPDTYEEITKNIKERCSLQILDKTACNEYVEKYINEKYINWSGEVSDVRDGEVYVHLQKTIVLHDSNNPELKKGQRIRFQARNKIEKHWYEGNYFNIWTGLDKIDLYDAHIQPE